MDSKCGICGIEGNEEDVMDCLVLQPILENSIRHGFQNMKHGGRIQVEGVRSKTGWLCG